MNVNRFLRFFDKKIAVKHLNRSRIKMLRIFNPDLDNKYFIG